MLKPFRIPDGIRGSIHSASVFIVPRGVAVPSGDTAAVVVMDWNALKE